MRTNSGPETRWSERRLDGRAEPCKRCRHARMYHHAHPYGGCVGPDPTTRCICGGHVELDLAVALGGWPKSTVGW